MMFNHICMFHPEKRGFSALTPGCNEEVMSRLLQNLRAGKQKRILALRTRTGHHWWMWCLLFIFILFYLQVYARSIFHLLQTKKKAKNYIISNSMTTYAEKTKRAHASFISWSCDTKSNKISACLPTSSTLDQQVWLDQEMIDNVVIPTGSET